MKKALTIILAAVAVLSSCNRKEYARITGYAQGGTYSIKCSIPEGASANWPQQAKDSIDAILGDIDFAVSGYNKASLLSRQNGGETITDDGSRRYRILCGLTDYCDSLFLETDGALDTRAAALFDVWGFGFKSGEMPSADEVAAAAADRSRMNFNAVAQGYSADMVADFLRSEGVEDMLVDIGGEIYCSGVNPNGKGWTIGIDAPVDGNMTPGESLSGTFSIEPGQVCGVVTSGNYRKFYVKNGVKYSHTIDPRSAAPVKHNLLSATIIAPTSALADALATYCMVIGFEKASEFIESREDLEGCLITSDTIWHSSGFNLSK